MLSLLENIMLVNNIRCSKVQQTMYIYKIKIEDVYLKIKIEYVYLKIKIEYVLL